MPKSLSLVDRKILQAASNGKTPTELEKEFAGFSAIEIYARVKELLSNYDVFDEIEQRKLLIVSLKDLKGRVERVLDVSDHRQVNALRDVILAIDKVMGNARKATDEEVQRLIAEQTARMIHLIALSYGRVRDTLSQEFPEIPMEQIDGVFYAELEANYAFARDSD